MDLCETGMTELSGASDFDMPVFGLLHAYCYFRSFIDNCNMETNSTELTHAYTHTDMEAD